VEISVIGFNLEAKNPELTDLMVTVEHGKLGINADVRFKNLRFTKNAHLWVVLENNKDGGFSYVGSPEVSGFMGADKAQSKLAEYDVSYINSFLTGLLNKQLGDVGNVAGYKIEDDTVRMNFKKTPRS